MRAAAPFQRVALAVAALAAFAAPASAAPTKTMLLAKALEGAAICAQTMPDEKATAAALKAKGFSLHDADGQVKAFLAEGKRVLVGMTVEHNSRTGCMVSASQMTVAEAMDLIQPWLAEAQAQPIPVSTSGKVAAAWSGVFKGGPVELAVLNPDNVITFRGATIVARSAR